MTPEELQQSLASVLGWDPVVAEGVVEAIVAASSKSEVDDIVRVGFLQSGSEASQAEAHHLHSL